MPSLGIGRERAGQDAAGFIGDGVGFSHKHFSNFAPIRSKRLDRRLDLFSETSLLLRVFLAEDLLAIGQGQSWKPLGFADCPTVPMAKPVVGLVLPL